MRLFSGRWKSSRENSGIEIKFLFSSKSDKATVPVDLDTNMLKEITNQENANLKKEKKTNDVAGRERTMDVSQTEDLSVTSVT
jgi:hypothetical protein